MSAQYETINFVRRRAWLHRRFKGIGGVLVEEFRVQGVGEMRRITDGKEQWWEPIPDQKFIGPAQVRKMIAEEDKERAAKKAGGATHEAR
jgi:hypothetical protein